MFHYCSRNWAFPCLLGVPDCYWAFSAMDWALLIAIGRSRLYIGRSETQHFQSFRPGNLKTWKSQILEKTRIEKWSISVWSKVLQLTWRVDWWQNRCWMLDAWCLNTCQTHPQREAAFSRRRLQWVWQVFKHQASSIKPQASSIKPQASSIKKFGV